MTRFIPTRVHGLIDLTTPPVLLAVPALLGLDRSSLAALAPRAAGLSALAYSLVTDYETAPRRTLPMPVHLALDAMSGAALAAAPWLSGDARRGTRYETTVTANAQLRRLRVGHVLPLGARIRSVRLNGQAVRGYDVRRTNRGQELTVTVPTGTAQALVVEVER